MASHRATHPVPYAPPYDFAGLLAWFAPRAIDGVETVTEASYARTLRLPGGPATVIVRDDPARHRLLVDVGAAPGDVPAALAVVRHLFDTGLDPAVMDSHLAGHPLFAPLVEDRPGIRLPGSAGLPEALTRAIAGQQITVVQARSLLGRMAWHGERVETGVPGLDRLVPEPEVIAGTVDEWFRGPGARRETLRAVLAGLARSGWPAEAGELRDWLLAQRGIGPWTADYVVMRAAHHRDTVPSPDVALRTGARRLGLAQDYPELLRALRPLSPWRSYAALHLWRAAARPDETVGGSAAEG